MSKWSTWIDEVNPETLDQKYRRMLIESGFNILGELSHYFEPYGYTKIYLLAESHFAIHTFPEEQKTYIELSSCNEIMYKAFLQLHGKTNNE